MELAYYRTLTPTQQAPIRGFVNTNAAHIFPPSTNRNLDPEQDDDPKVFYVRMAAVFSVIHHT